MIAAVLVLLDSLAQISKKRQSNATVFVGTVIDDAVLIDVENSAKEKLEMLGWVNEIGNISKVAM